MIHHYASLDSTNRLALELAGQGSRESTVVWADRQTGGKGRAGRTFCSPEGGLYFSLIVNPRSAIHELPLVTLAAGVGVCRTLIQETEAPVRIKWPNDLYLRGRKLGGILTESGPFAAGGGPAYLVVGVGINLRTDLRLFPSSLRGKVISLYHGKDDDVDREALLNKLSQAVQTTVARLGRAADGVLTDWRRYDFLRGRTLSFSERNREKTAIGVGLADDGRYVVRDRSGTEYFIVAGDVNPIRVASPVSLNEQCNAI